MQAIRALISESAKLFSSNIFWEFWSQRSEISLEEYKFAIDSDNGTNSLWRWRGYSIRDCSLCLSLPNYVRWHANQSAI